MKKKNNKKGIRCLTHNLRKIYHHGRGSKPLLVCKDCKKIITPHERALEKVRKEKDMIRDRNRFKKRKSI